MPGGEHRRGNGQRAPQLMSPTSIAMLLKTDATRHPNLDHYATARICDEWFRSTAGIRVIEDIVVKQRGRVGSSVLLPQQRPSMSSA